MTGHRAIGLFGFQKAANRVAMTPAEKLPSRELLAHFGLRVLTIARGCS